MSERTTLDLTGYKLTFDDEFNSFSSNGPSNYQVRSHTGTWDTTLSYGERRLNDEVELYSDTSTGTDPFSVLGGVLDIHAAPSRNPSENWGAPYTSGVITTNHSFLQLYHYSCDFSLRCERFAKAWCVRRQSDHEMTWAGWMRRWARRMAMRRISWMDHRMRAGACDSRPVEFANDPACSRGGGCWLSWRTPA